MRWSPRSGFGRPIGRRASSPFLLEVPEKDRRGFRHVFLYRETDGMHLIGSQDGIHWDRSSDVEQLSNVVS
ncbi:MAG: hypothetical protein KY476_27145 [Planctomycetes bacterium]|nr:hypothetical protein [Planctomycetota bacterium]